MNKQQLKEYRFNHLGGQWYLDTLRDLSYKYQEKKENNEEFKDAIGERERIIKEYLELEQEYKEWEKWAKKEVKKRQKIAIERYINNSIVY